MLTKLNQSPYNHHFCIYCSGFWDSRCVHPSQARKLAAEAVRVAGIKLQRAALGSGAAIMEVARSAIPGRKGSTARGHSDESAELPLPTNGGPGVDDGSSLAVDTEQFVP